MAKLRGNLFGNFQGKLGLSYGRMVHGVNLGANMPTPRGKGYIYTASEKDRMERFKVLAQLASAFQGANDLGLKAKAKQMGPLVSPFDAFMNLNSPAVSVVGGEAEVDYGSIICSKGKMPIVAFGNASFAEPARVSVSFQTSADQPGTDALDKVYCLIYQPDTNQAIITPGAARTTGSVDQRVPTAWTGMTVHVYGFAIGGGEDNKGIACDSSYIGTGNIG